nr:MAG TPA: hypothetical protein [Caudoviricetes sp.]
MKVKFDSHSKLLKFVVERIKLERFLSLSILIVYI